MPSSRANVPRRWLRLLLLIGALASAAAGQYWLSLGDTSPLRDLLPGSGVPSPRAPLAWAVAIACFLLLYVSSSRDERVLPSTDEAELPRTVEWVLFGLVLCVGTFFVVFRLSEFPPGLNHDAAWEGMYSIRILNGEPYTAYANEAWGRETFTFYLKALSIKLLGATQLGVEGPSIVGGILILPFLYWWARNMFGARVAVMATLLLGASGWHLIFSRTGWRSDLQPLFTVITCCFFIRGMITAGWLDFALSGIGLAATLNTYNGARAFPLLFPLWVVLVILQSWQWRGFLRRYGTGLAAFIASFSVAVAPLVWVALTRWHEFTGRAAYLVGASSFVGNLKTAALLFNYWGNGDDFFVSTPGLEVPAAIFLVFGFLWLLARWRDERAQFVLLGLAVNILPGIVSSPNLNRSVGTMPFIFFVSALGVVFFARALTRLVPRVGALLAGLLLVVVAGTAVYATYTEFLGQHRRDIWGYYPETTVIGRYVGTLIPHYVTWVGGANYPRDTITFLSYQGVGNPERRNYVWLDDVTELLRQRLSAPAGKGLAFVLSTDHPGPAVLNELKRRYPNHQTAELHTPGPGGGVFARALLVPPEGVTAAPAAPEGAAAPPTNESLYPQDPPGKLHGARGVAVTKAGTAVVCDFGNNRIQEFNHDLGFVAKWGNRGDGQGEFKDPCGIAVGPGDEVFVADTWNHRVQVFSPAHGFLREWSGFFSPRGVAVDASGRVFVADSGGNRIVRFAPDGKKQIEWGKKGDAPGEFSEPIGIATDAAGQVYVCDNANARLQIFTGDGVFVSSFKVPGWASVGFSEPYVALDDAGRIWVTVPTEKTVRAYDKTGKLLRTITGSTIAGAAFNTPMGIAYDPLTKELVVSDLDGPPVRFPAVEK
jgi:DNA-binding beta-propeller fold protein YncE